MSDLRELAESCVFAAFDSTTGNLVDDATPTILALLDERDKYRAALEEIKERSRHTSFTGDIYVIAKGALA